MHQNRVAGLCFSGGGIRSATFNLGLLQGMAAQVINGKSILENFDYLSTVSGGGYIHQWFAAWIKRETDFKQVIHHLIPLPAPHCDPLHPAALTWLRRYSSYLTPDKGFFKQDTWVVFAIWLRNTFLNQLVLISSLLLLVLVPHFFTSRNSTRHPQSHDASRSTLLETMDLPFRHVWQPLCTLTSRSDKFNFKLSVWWKYIRGVVTPLCHSGTLLALGAIILFAIGVATTAFWLKRARNHADCQEESGPAEGGDGESGSAEGGQGAAQAIVAFLLLSSLCVTGFLNNDRAWEQSKFALSYVVFLLLFVANATVVHAGGAQQAFETLNAFDESNSGLRRLWVKIQVIGGLILSLSAVAAAGATAWFLLMTWAVFSGLPLLAAKFHLYGHGFDPWRLILVAGPPLFLSVPFFSQVLLAGLIGRDFADWLREWLASIRAWSFIIGVTWAAWFGASLLTRPLLLAIWDSTPHGRPSALIGWVLTTFGSVLAAKSPKTQGETTGTSSSVKALNLLAVVGPYVFVTGLMLLLAWAVDKALSLSLTHPHLYPCLVIGGLLSVFCLFGWRVDINEFSMHTFYRNRLTRCYLGATNRKRKPDPLTGFDEGDTKDTVLSTFRVDKYKGPFPIFCSTLNLTFGEDLAWQQRKAASFIFTPLYSGYHVGWTTGIKKHVLSYNGYVPTRTFAYPNGGINMATAVAISGAAVSPNWGYHTSPATAFLMTMFNVRLGWWLRNPRTSKYAGQACSSTQLFDADETPSPRFPAGSLINELRGSVTDSSDFVYLTDGGHFENMGLYELIRRRCRFVVVCDAEEDHAFTFGGIGNAIQRCRIDFGVEIDLNLGNLRPQMDPQLGYPVSKCHFVSGTVRYPERMDDEAPITGRILYIKASLTGQTPQFKKANSGAITNLPGESGDLLKQRLGNAAFPNDSTANQWFDEETFESYRRLGIHIAEEIERCGQWTPNLP
ncbi:apolipoprotein N-acyltransferase [Terriglobus roseus DSM 18391]|nr:apolipoprotein N-acyltransferase [Terriglobus roseus DSM 18391]